MFVLKFHGQTFLIELFVKILTSKSRVTKRFSTITSKHSSATSSDIFPTTNIKSASISNISSACGWSNLASEAPSTMLPKKWVTLALFALP